MSCETIPVDTANSHGNHRLGPVSYHDGWTLNPAHSSPCAFQALLTWGIRCTHQLAPYCVLKA
jgi:hypothetical protein